MRSVPAEEQVCIREREGEVPRDGEERAAPAAATSRPLIYL